MNQTKVVVVVALLALIAGCIPLAFATGEDDAALFASLHTRFVHEVEASISVPSITSTSTLAPRTVIGTMNLTADNAIMANDRNELALEILRLLASEPADKPRRRFIESLPVPRNSPLLWSTEQAAKVAQTWLYDRLEYELRHADELQTTATATRQQVLEAMALAYRYGVRVLIGSEHKYAILPIVSLASHQEIGYQFGQFSRQEKLLYHGAATTVWSQFSKFERMYLDLFLDAEDVNYAAKEEYLIKHNIFSGLDYPLATNLYADYSGVVSADALAFARTIISPLAQLPADPRQPHDNLTLELKALKELQQLLQDKVTRFGTTASVERVRTKKRGSSSDFEKMTALVRQLEAKTCDNALAWLQQREFQLQKKAAPPIHPERKSRQQVETLIEKGKGSGL